METIQERRDPLIPAIAKMPEFTTGERCALVADIIEQHPERHDQVVWVGAVRTVDDPDVGTIRLVAAAGSCGTAACVAGWAVAASPVELVGEIHDWVSAGARALGLDYHLAALVFDGASKREKIVKMLRWCATVGPGDRTTERAEEALGVGQYQLPIWLGHR